MSTVEELQNSLQWVPADTMLWELCIIYVKFTEHHVSKTRLVTCDHFVITRAATPPIGAHEETGLRGGIPRGDEERREEARVTKMTGMTKMEKEGG